MISEFKKEERDFIVALTKYGLSKSNESLGAYPIATLDWAYVLGQLMIHRLGPLAFCASTRDNCISDIPHIASWWLFEISRLNDIRQRLLLSAASEISAKLRQCGIAHSFLKGVVLQSDYYGGLNRQYDDLDLLVEPTNLSIVTEVLRSNGFIQGWRKCDEIVPATRYEIVSSRVNSHELVPFWRRTTSDAVPYVSVDVQFEFPGTKLFGLDFDVSELLRHRRMTTTGDGAVPKLCPVHHLILLCTHQQMHAVVPDEVQSANDLVLLRLSDLVRVMVSITRSGLCGEFVRLANSGRALGCVVDCLSTLVSLYGARMFMGVISACGKAIEERLASTPAYADRQLIRDRVFDIGSRSR